MNIFSILKNLYTNKKSDWIKNANDEDIQPYLIQRWLTMNDAVRVQSRWLDKYVFVLPPKMYLSLAWSVLPKTSKTPYVKYIKKNNEEEEFDFILTKVRKHFKLADNDFATLKERILNNIKSNMSDWFCYYGVEKKYWKRYGLDFNKIKTYGVVTKTFKNLGDW